MNRFPEVYTTEVSLTVKGLILLYSGILDTFKFDAFKKPKQDSFETVEDILINHSKKDTEVAQQLSSYYGNRSWYLLFALKFKEAEQAAKRGLTIKSTFTWIKSNLAHSLLFQGKYEEALNLYLELKLLKYKGGKSYAAICLEGLDELEKNGVTNKNVSRIRAFLKE